MSSSMDWMRLMVVEDDDGVRWAGLVSISGRREEGSVGAMRQSMRFVSVWDFPRDGDSFWLKCTLVWRIQCISWFHSLCVLGRILVLGRHPWSGRAAASSCNCSWQWVSIRGDRNRFV